MVEVTPEGPAKTAASTSTSTAAAPKRPSNRPSPRGDEFIPIEQRRAGRIQTATPIEGPGIAPGTKISHELRHRRLSSTRPTTSKQTNVQLNTELPANASAEGIEQALQTIPGLGPDNVFVTPDGVQPVHPHLPGRLRRHPGGHRTGHADRHLVAHRSAAPASSSPRRPRSAIHSRSPRSATSPPARRSSPRRRPTARTPPRSAP